MVGHPNFEVSKQAFSIICRESPLQSASWQTLHPSNDNLNFLLDILTAFKSDRDTVYLIQTQSCEKLLTKNYWIHWIDLGEHKSIIFLQWTNYLVSNCLVLNLDGISDFKVSCCKTYSAYDMQHKWCIELFWSLAICWITSKHRWSFIVKFIHRRHKQAWPVSTVTQCDPLNWQFHDPIIEQGIDKKTFEKIIFWNQTDFLRG